MGSPWLARSHPEVSSVFIYDQAVHACWGLFIYVASGQVSLPSSHGPFLLVVSPVRTTVSGRRSGSTTGVLVRDGSEVEEEDGDKGTVCLPNLALFGGVRAWTRHLRASMAPLLLARNTGPRY